MSSFLRVESASASFSLIQNSFLFVTIELQIRSSGLILSEIDTFVLILENKTNWFLEINDDLPSV